jgi:pimeloyl-ACP methyl ester carboxylesterase
MSKLLAYIEQGEGDPLILVHGFCESKAIWKDFIPTLSRRFRVIALDLGGFGDSADFLPKPAKVETLAEQVNDLWLQLGIDRAVMIGHSLGGYVSLAFAEKYPDKLLGLGLFHSTALADSDEKKKTRNNVIEFVEKHGVEKFIESFVEPLFYSKRHTELQGSIYQVKQIASETPEMSVLEVTKAMRDRPERTAVLRNASYPVMFIIGREDGAVAFESYHQQVMLAPESFVHILPQTAHMGMYERKEETLNMIEFFTEYCYDK